MSTIYRYLDVLSVEKCIDNINDFIKKRIFIIMSVIGSRSCKVNNRHNLNND